MAWKKQWITGKQSKKLPEEAVTVSHLEQGLTATYHANKLTSLGQIKWSLFTLR